MIKTVSAITTGLIFMSGAAYAEASARPVYIDVSYVAQQTDVQDDLGELIIGQEVSFTALGLRGGYRIDRNFSVELEVDLGMSGEGVTKPVEFQENTVNFDGDIDVNYTTGVFGVYNIPLTEDGRFNLFGRVGLMVGEVEASGDISTVILGIPATVPGSYTEQSSGPVVGAGVSYDLTDNIYVRGDATYIGQDSFPTMSYGLGLGLRF